VIIIAPAESQHVCQPTITHRSPEFLSNVANSGVGAASHL